MSPLSKPSVDVAWNWKASRSRRLASFLPEDIHTRLSIRMLNNEADMAGNLSLMKYLVEKVQLGKLHLEHISRQ